MVIGSIIVPPFPNPMNHQNSFLQKINRVDSSISKPPPPLTSPLDVEKQNGDLHVQRQQVPTANTKLPRELSVKVTSPATDLRVDAKDSHGDDCSNLAKAFLGKFDIQPCHEILGKPCVSFSIEDKNRLLASMNYILVVKFSHFRPKFFDFNSFMVKMKFMGKYRIFEFDLKHVFVEFLVFEDFIKLWMLKSCMIGGYRGRLFQWDCDFMPNIESSIAPIWVHLPHFPLYLFNEKAILSVASVFGKPIYIDSTSLKREKVGKLSICVAKDVNVKGPSEIMVEFVGDGMFVERFNQVVTYGEIPDHCPRCLHMGHCLEDCKVLAAFDKDLGAVSSRLKEVEIPSLGNVVPIVSIFNRVNKDIANKVSMDDNMVLDMNMVLVEDVTEGDEVGCGFTLGDRTNPRAYNSCHDSPTAPSLGTSSVVPRAMDQVVLVGIDNMLPKNDVRAGMEVEAGVEDLVMEVVKPVDAVVNSSIALFSEPHIKTPGASGSSSMAGTSSMVAGHEIRAGDSGFIAMEGLNFDPQNEDIRSVLGDIADRSNTPFLEPVFSVLEDIDLGTLAGSSSMISKVDVYAYKALESAGEAHVLSGGKSADEPQSSGLQMPISDRPASPSLRLHISDPGTEVQGLLAVSDSLISKAEVRDANDLSKAGEELDSAAETPVNEPLAAGLSKELNISISGPPSRGSLEGTSGGVLRWLGKQVGLAIQENLQQKKPDHEEFDSPKVAHKETSSSQKIIIRDPVTKEVVHISPKSNSPVEHTKNAMKIGLSKNAKKKLRKKQKKKELLLSSSGQGSIILIANSEVGNEHISTDTASPLPTCVSSKQDWEGLDSNESKDTPFWSNFHAAQEDLSQLDRPEQYPYMFTLNSEDERLSSMNSSSLVSQTSKDTGTSELDIQQLQMAYQSATDFIEEVALQRPRTSSVESISSDVSTSPEASSQEEVHEVEAADLLPLLEAYHKGHFDVQVTPSKETEDASSSHDLVAVKEQVTPSNACMNKTVSSPPSTQISWAQEVEAADALTVGDLYETIPYDKELVIISGGGVVSYPCPWINSEDRDLLPEEHDLIHKLVTQYPFEFSMSGVPIERWCQVDAAKASKKFHKEQFEPP